MQIAQVLCQPYRHSYTNWMEWAGLNVLILTLYLTMFLMFRCVGAGKHQQRIHNK